MIYVQILYRFVHMHCKKTHRALVVHNVIVRQNTDVNKNIHSSYSEHPKVHSIYTAWQHCALKKYIYKILLQIKVASYLLLQWWWQKTEEPGILE